MAPTKIFVVTILSVFSNMCFCQEKTFELNGVQLQQTLFSNYVEKDYPKSEGYFYQGFSVKDNRNDFTLSHITITLYEETLTDYDADGNYDIWVEIMDEGVGGGGNAFVNYIGLAHMKSNTDATFHALFESSKFSDFSYWIKEIKNGTPVINQSVGYQGAYSALPLPDTRFYLGYGSDGTIRLLNYNDCEMAQMEVKNTLNEDVDADEIFHLGHTFEEAMQEVYQENGYTFAFKISGCHYFEFEMQVFGLGDAQALKTKLIEVGLNKSRFTTLFKKMKTNQIPIVESGYGNDSIATTEFMIVSFQENEPENSLKINYFNL